MCGISARFNLLFNSGSSLHIMDSLIENSNSHTCEHNGQTKGKETTLPSDEESQTRDKAASPRVAVKYSWGAINRPAVPPLNTWVGYGSQTKKNKAKQVIQPGHGSHAAADWRHRDGLWWLIPVHNAENTTRRMHTWCESWVPKTKIHRNRRTNIDLNIYCKCIRAYCYRLVRTTKKVSGANLVNTNQRTLVQSKLPADLARVVVSVCFQTNQGVRFLNWLVQWCGCITHQ